MPQCNDHHSKVVDQCAGSRQQVEGFKQPRPHANSLSTELAAPDSNAPSSRRTVPSCAIAAVLVVAAGLVCCRPTIGQRGIQCGGIGRTRASLKLESLFNFSDTLKLIECWRRMRTNGCLRKVFGSSAHTEDKIVFQLG